MIGITRLAIPFILLAAVMALACGKDPEEGTVSEAPAGPQMLSVTSTAFSEGESIPVVHTCDGEDRSPPLAWSGVPADAMSLALIVDDPDAPGGDFVHWVLYKIPSETRELGIGVSKDATTAFGADNGRSGFGDLGYGGPCPPRGSPHRYFFKLYALDAEPNLEPGAGKAELLNEIQGHILAEGQLMGRYQRQ